MAAHLPAGPIHLLEYPATWQGEGLAIGLPPVSQPRPCTTAEAEFLCPHLHGQEGVGMQAVWKVCEGRTGGVEGV